MGQRRTKDSAGHWYLIAGEGEMVVRVHSSLRLGETAAGTLSFDPADPQITLTISDQDELVIQATSGHELSRDGKRSQRELCSRQMRTQVRLANNHVYLDTKATDRQDADATIEVHNTTQAIGQGAHSREGTQPLADAAGPRGNRVGDLRPRPTGAAARRRHPGGGEISIGQWFKPVTESQPDDTTWPAEKSPEVHTHATQRATQQISPTPDEPDPGRPNRRHGRLVSALVALACVGIALMYFLPDGPRVATSPSDSMQSADAQRPGEATTNTTVAATARGKRDRVERLPTSIPQPVLLPSPVSNAVEATGLPMAEAAPEPQQQSGPPEVEREPEPVAPEPAVREIATLGPAERETAAPEPAPETRTAQSRQQPLRASPPDPAVLAALDEAGQALAAEAAEWARRRDLLAANLALEQGRLTTPPEASAYALYQRVLSANPASPEAKAGLQSVRQGLVNRALAQLAANALGEASATLEAASEAGAHPMLIADLRSEIEYRQRQLGGPVSGRNGN